MAHYYGIYQGIVTNTKDELKRGRIKAKIPDVFGAEVESAWCEPCIMSAFDKEFSGDFYVPFKGEGVWIMFNGGDVNYPVWLGGWWKDKKTPLKVADYKYPKLDDVRVISYRDFKITIHKDEVTFENCGEHSDSKIKNKVVMDKKGFKITSDKDVELTIKGNLKITADKNITINAGTDLKLVAGNNLSESAGNNHSESAGVAISESAGVSITESAVLSSSTTARTITHTELP